MSSAAFPALRLRRTRAHAWSRALVAETVLTPSDLIWPLFVTEGEGIDEPIATLPGVSRWSVDRVGDRVREAEALGIPCVALFPNTPPRLRSDDAGEALNPDNLICRAVKAAKDAAPGVGVLTDVALDPYTAHGHDGLTDATGYVVNDATVAKLADQALVQAAAGADIVAPSDMMDGRVGAIRSALEQAGQAILGGEPVEVALHEARRTLSAAGFHRIDYFALVDSATLEPLDAPSGEMRLIAAAVIGTTRLIDNIRVISDTV